MGYLNNESVVLRRKKYVNKVEVALATRVEQPYKVSWLPLLTDLDLLIVTAIIESDEYDFQIQFHHDEDGSVSSIIFWRDYYLCPSCEFWHHADEVGTKLGAGASPPSFPDGLRPIFDVVLKQVLVESDDSGVSPI